METTYDFTVALIKSEPKDDYPKFPVADPLCTLPERMVSNFIPTIGGPTFDCPTWTLNYAY